MSLSKYLARDKSTIDQFISSRPPGAIDSADLLLLYDASEEEAKSVLVSDIIASAPVAEFDSGTQMLFQQAAAATGWTQDISPTFDQATVRVSMGNAPLSTGGTEVFSDVYQDQPVGGTVVVDTTNFTISPTALTEANLPVHTHGSGLRIQNNEPSKVAGAIGGATEIFEAPSSPKSANIVNDDAIQSVYTSPAEGSAGTGHTHPTAPLNHNHTGPFTGGTVGNMGLKYSDAIICSKD
jgi:hypothetical protein